MRQRVNMDQMHASAYRVGHHVSGTALAFRGRTIPDSQQNVGQVHDPLTCGKVRVLIRSRCVEYFYSRMLDKFTIN